jgi:hypothetical protein
MTDRSELGRLLVVPRADITGALLGGSRALTFDGLVGRLRDRFAPDLELATPAAVRLAFSGVAAEVAGADPWLGNVARRGGRSWLRLVDALDRALDGAVERESAVGIVAGGADSIAERARLLLTLMSALDERLAAAGLIDPRREVDRVTRAVGRVPPEEVARALGAREVKAQGVVDWTPSRLAFWRILDASLSRAGGRASIELPVIDRPLDAGRARDPLDVLADAVASALDDAPLGTAIVSPLSGVASARSRVEIRVSASRDAQAQAVADAVHAALLEGVSPGEIVVGMVSDDDVSASSILQALDDAEIPCTDARRLAPRSNLSAFADRALDVVAGGSQRAEVALLLRSPYVDAASLVGQAEEPARRTLNQLSRALEETPTVGKPDVADRLEATVLASGVARHRNGPLLARVALGVGRSLARVERAATRDELSRAVRALWRDLGVGRAAPVVLPRSPRDVDLLDVEARRRDRAAWSARTEALRAHDRASSRLGVGAEAVTLDAFRHELACVERAGEHESSMSQLAVSLVDSRDLPRRAGALVVVADASADAWPGGALDNDILSTPLLDRLSEATDPALQAIGRAGAAAEYARVALATDGARRVVFTYRARDPDGDGGAPAPVLAQLMSSAAVATWSSGCLPRTPLGERAARLAALAADPDSAVLIVPDPARRALVERRREEAFGAELADDHPLVRGFPRGPDFAAILTEETGGGARPVPATAMDVLASCGFRGFVGEVVRPRRTREVRDLADHRDAGRISHTALEEAFRATAALWAERPRDATRILREGLAAADRILEREHASSALARVAVRQLRGGVRAVLEWSLADLAWDFASAEQPFGDDTTWPAVVLEADGTRVLIRGRIDRVDVAHATSAVRVIDYKSRERATESHSASFGVGKFQLALYAQAACAALDRARGEGLYLATQRLRPDAPGTMRPDRWAAAHEIDGGVPRFARRVLDLVSGVRRGELAVRPASLASCAQCDFDGVCRKPKFAPAAPPDDVEIPDPG